jgi:hypothetical protein
MQEETDRVVELIHNLEEIWRNETATNRDRKRLLRCLPEEVQLTTQDKQYLIRIIWKGGAILTQSDLILDPTMFDDQGFPHIEVGDRPAIYSFVYSLKESFAGRNLLCKAVNVSIC